MIAQVLVGVVAPLADAWTPRSAIGAHVEQTGAGRHFAHDEATCAWCAARHLVVAVPRLAKSAALSSPRQLASLDVALAPIVGERRTPGAPRAPPRTPIG